MYLVLWLTEFPDVFHITNENPSIMMDTNLTAEFSDN
jgi:hypothetical protein